MQALTIHANRLLREEEAATIVEYVLLVSMVGILAIGSMKFLGSSAGNKLNRVSTNIATSN